MVPLVFLIMVVVLIGMVMLFFNWPNYFQCSIKLFAFGILYVFKWYVHFKATLFALKILVIKKKCLSVLSSQPAMCVFVGEWGGWECVCQRETERERS